MTRPNPHKLPGPMDLLAVGGPLHGHVVTVKSTTKRVLAMVAPDDRGQVALQLATHRASGAYVYEETSDAASYTPQRILGHLVLLSADVYEMATVDQPKKFVDALITYAGLEKH